MRSGKGENIISRVSPVNYIPNTRYEAFKPKSDNRTPGVIYSRLGGGISIPAIEIPDVKPWEVFNYIDNKVKVVLFDEAEFFSKEIVDVVEKLLDNKMNVIVSGLNLDFRGEPFGMMHYFITRADIATPLRAVCDYTEKDNSGQVVFKCGECATRTQRLIYGKPALYSDDLKKIGDTEGVDDKSVSYEARCRKHHEVPGKPPSCISELLSRY
jgi:thymidine kinase